MLVSMIVAHGKNFEIGLNNQMLWHISEDFKKFKSITMGKAILMGRKTYESIGRPLPGRLNIVLTRDLKKCKSRGDLQFVTSFEEALTLAKDHDNTELVICGGAQIYERYLPEVQKIYLSRVDFEGEADTFFPRLNLDQWKATAFEEHPRRDKAPAWSFEVLERI